MYAKIDPKTKRFVASHGMSGSPEYGTWESMIARCYQSKAKKYNLYGGRGIGVCVEWRGAGGFQAFFAHVGKRPSARHSLDRYPNRNGNYEPGNVRWATFAEQNRNTNRNVFITRNDITLCVADWESRLSVGRNTIQSRIRRGATKDEALTAVMEQIFADGYKQVRRCDHVVAPKEEDDLVDSW